MNKNISARLSVMMFLQFFLWSAWYNTVYNFTTTIGFSGGDNAWTYSVGPIAGMIAPFFVGVVADRFFSTEKILGFLHILGGLMMFAAIYVMNGGIVDENGQVIASVVNLVLFAHMLCYFPTLSLTNSISLHNMNNAEKEFPKIRVYGTIGWIVAANIMGLLKWNSSINMFYTAGISAIALGLYCFTLPHTPPPAKGEKANLRKILGLDALMLLKNPFYLVFMIASTLICIPLAFYYQLISRFLAQASLDLGGIFSEPSNQMSLGQMSEILFMLIMPFCFSRLGVKWMLFIGMLCWVIRYFLFAFSVSDNTAWMIIGGILLHGICYDFFFVTGQIYTDKIAPKKLRGQAQGLLAFFTIGLGMFIGAQIGGMVEGNHTTKKSQAFGAQSTEISKQIFEKYRDNPDKRDDKDFKEEIKELNDKKNELSVKAAENIEWKELWVFPAVFAGVILVIFTLAFRDGNIGSKDDEDDEEAGCMPDG